jgi:hypothetical protein
MRRSAYWKFMQLYFVRATRTSAEQSLGIIQLNERVTKFQNASTWSQRDLSRQSRQNVVSWVRPNVSRWSRQNVVWSLPRFTRLHTRFAPQPHTDTPTRFPPRPKARQDCTYQKNAMFSPRTPQKQVELDTPVRPKLNAMHTAVRNELRSEHEKTDSSATPQLQ